MIRLRCLSFALTLLSVTGPLLGQTFRFDMGPGGSVTAPGFTPVKPSTMYQSASGYGWVTPPIAARNRAGVSSQFRFDEGNFPPNLIEDSVGSSGSSPPIVVTVVSSTGLNRLTPASKIASCNDMPRLRA